MKTIQKLRKQFRESCLKRDNNRCRACNFPANNLVVHHIINRKEIVNGGYVTSNGITLCEECHWRAETALQAKEKYYLGYGETELFKKIGSSETIARSEASHVKPN
jgi:5-methylcytosine-specific restriction endonuclease McrA